MEFNKINLSLFDTLGFLLPGLIILFSLSIVESSFFNSSILSISNLNNNWLLSGIIAYFLGQSSYRLASMLQNTWPNLFIAKEQRLPDSIYYHIREVLKEIYSIKFEEGERLHSLETYLLADSYIVASGKTDERDSLLVREGFHKNSMVSFAVVSIVVFFTIFNHGITLQLSPDTYFSVGLVESLLLLILFILMTVMFWRGFVFFNRLKINNSLLLALSLRTLDLDRENS